MSSRRPVRRSTPIETSREFVEEQASDAYLPGRSTRAVFRRVS